MLRLGFHFGPGSQLEYGVSQAYWLAVVPAVWGFRLAGIGWLAISRGGFIESMARRRALGFHKAAWLASVGWGFTGVLARKATVGFHGLAGSHGSNGVS